MGKGYAYRYSRVTSQLRICPACFQPLVHPHPSLCSPYSPLF